MRITVIGNCASGKTTLARKISQKFDIPLTHLDRFWFETGGHKLKKEDAGGKEKARAYMRAKVEAFVKQSSWVSDGWYSRVQTLIAESADQIVFLDLPLWLRLASHLRRVFSSERHPELSRWDDVKFFPEIVRRTFKHGAAMRRFVNEHPDKVVRLLSHKEADRYLLSLNRDS